MATKQELNKYYYNKFNKDVPSATLSKWVKEGKLIATKINNRYDYDLESFIRIINSNEYIKNSRRIKNRQKIILVKSRDTY